MNPVVRVYVRLLDEGVEVWRPVGAAEEAPGLYRLLGPKPDETELWEFEPDDLVRCAPRKFSDGNIGLVAVERVGERRSIRP